MKPNVLLSLFPLGLKYPPVGFPSFKLILRQVIEEMLGGIGSKIIMHTMSQYAIVEAADDEKDFHYARLARFISLREFLNIIFRI
jgi:hypothetical protein